LLLDARLLLWGFGLHLFELTTQSETLTVTELQRQPVTQLLHVLLIVRNA